MNKMIVIADSGSTKTDWCVAEAGTVVRRMSTQGINPFFQTEDEIAHEIKEALLPQLEGLSLSEVFFYGAGCAFPEKNESVRRAIARFLPQPVHVGSDLLAAARAVCGDAPGIACILGTGSNSCQYDGKEIVRNISPLGFILGDEGSGAVLGKLLVGDLLKNQLPETLREQFFSEFDMTPAMLMERVYKQPFPNRFLASLSPFLIRNIDDPAIDRLVTNSFRAFFTRNVMQYAYSEYSVHLVGSVAWYYQHLLKEVAMGLGIRLGTIVQSPVEGLVAYHAGKGVI